MPCPLSCSLLSANLLEVDPDIIKARGSQIGAIMAAISSQHQAWLLPVTRVESNQGNPSISPLAAHTTLPCADCRCEVAVTRLNLSWLRLPIADSAGWQRW